MDSFRDAAGAANTAKYAYQAKRAAQGLSTSTRATAVADLVLGANAATRDWQEIPGRLLPLPSADSHRFLMTSPDLVEPARRIFKGQPGIEMAYPSGEGAAGELAEVVRAGYPRHAGIFGAHRHHHAATDDLSTVAAEPLAATARGFRDLLTAAIPADR